MRIYNGKKSQVDLPLSGDVRISIGPGSVSRDVMPSQEFLSLVATSYDETELALIIGGPYEVNMCAHIPAVAPLIVQSLDAAIQRFQGPKAEPIKPVQVSAPVVEEKVEEEVPVEEEEIVPQMAETDPFEKEFPEAEFPVEEAETEESAATEETKVDGQPKGKKKNNKKKK